MGEALVARDALSRPRAAVFLSLAGLKEQASHVATIFGDRLARRADVAAGTGRQSASPILGALEAVAKANPDVPIAPLGGDAACGDACLEAALAALAPQIGAAYAPAAGGAPMAGALTLTPAVTFDLSRPADRAFAAELASLYAAASARNGAPSLADDVELMAGTLTALQGVADAYGADSAAYAAAADALVADLRVSVAQLDAAFGGDAVYALGFVPAGAGAEARAATRRLLGSQPFYPGVDEATAAKIFSAKAAGYGAFVAALYFALAGVWCMCNMKMKTDTLLYPRQKAE